MRVEPDSVRGTVGRVHGLRLAASVAFAALLAACAATPPAPEPLPPAPDVSGIHAFLRAHDAEDARFQPVSDRAFLKVDLRLRYHARSYAEASGVEERRAFVVDFLRQAESTGERAVTEALDWVAPGDVIAFNAKHGVADTGDPFEAVLGAYRADAGRRLAHEIERVEALTDTAAVDAYWEGLSGAIEESIMTRGRLARKLLNAPAVPFINGWIAYHNRHDYRGPLNPEFAEYDVYRPGDDFLRHDEISGSDWALLRRYAPTIVQERATDDHYPDEFNHFGAISLVGAELGLARPVVDPEQPAVYAYVDRKTIQGVSVRQLNYTIWYPQHPAMSLFDPEEGALDGWTVRITLDAADRPQLVESVSNCGCYYKIFPSAHLEAASRTAFPEKIDGKVFHLERHLADGVDAVVPETIPGLDQAPHGIAIYMSAGHHQLVSVRARSPRADVSPDSGRRYGLAAYDALEHLPFQDHAASMFGTDGLVRQAHRRECTLLSPSGVYHAGHPRQRETQMIYFDESDFDDPGLLQRYLRLPPAALGGGA